MNLLRRTPSTRKTERRTSELLQIQECEALTNEICTKNGVRVKKRLGNREKKEGKRTSRQRYRGERKVVEKTCRQSGEEDEVQPTGRIPQPEPNPIPLGRPRTWRFLRPKRSSPNLIRQPACIFSFTREWPITRERPITCERPVTRVRPRPASDSITRASTWDPCTRVALWLCHVARRQRGSDGLFGSGNLFPARCHHSNPPGLSSDPV